MTTARELAARIQRLEQRTARPPAQATTLAPPSVAKLRTVIAMLMEAGAFYAPSAGGALWQVREQLQAHLGLEDDAFRPAGIAPEPALTATAEPTLCVPREALGVGRGENLSRLPRPPAGTPHFVTAGGRP